MKVWLLTTEEGGEGGGEWDVQSIHSTEEGAVKARDAYRKPRVRGDGSWHSPPAEIEPWTMEP